MIAQFLNVLVKFFYMPILKFTDAKLDGLNERKMKRTSSFMKF